MRGLLLFAMFVLAGCDRLFGLSFVQGGDANPADADIPPGVDAPPMTICETLSPAPAFCEDFDREPIELQAWDSTPVAGGGALMLVPSTRSRPSALESMTPGDSDSGSLTQARVSKAITVPSTYQAVTVAFDMNIAARTNPVTPIGAFTVRASTNFVFDIASTNAQNAYSILNNTAATQVGFPYPLGVWHRVEIRIARQAAQVTISLFLDGFAVNGGDGVVATGTGPPAGSPYEIHVGAAGETGNGECRFHFDNIVVTVM